jgi:hypothetical protein
VKKVKRGETVERGGNGGKWRQRKKRGKEKGKKEER